METVVNRDRTGRQGATRGKRAVGMLRKTANPIKSCVFRLVVKSKNGVEVVGAMTGEESEWAKDGTRTGQRFNPHGQTSLFCLACKLCTGRIGDKTMS